MDGLMGPGTRPRSSIGRALGGHRWLPDSMESRSRYRDGGVQVRILAGTPGGKENPMEKHCFVLTMILLLIAIGFGITRKKK